MTTFTTYEVYNSSILNAARWLLETATKMNGKAFLPWEAADYEIRNTEYMYENYEDLDVRLDAIPTPPKVGVKFTSYHSSVQIEDVFHYSVVDLCEPVLSNGNGNEFVYAIAKALRRFASIVAPDGGPVLLQIKDWCDDTALEREMLTYTPIHQHHDHH